MRCLSVMACCALSLAAVPADATEPANVQEIVLAETVMTPIELVLTRAVPAGTVLRLRQERRLRPVVVGLYAVTRIRAEGLPEPMALRDVPTYEDIRGRWGFYERTGQLAVLEVPVDLPAGTRLTVEGRKYDGVDPVRQRYTGRATRLWLEPVPRDDEETAAVSAPLIVRTASGPIDTLAAYRKPDGRLLIQAFDRADNPADSAGRTYTISGDGPDRLQVAATPGYDLTEVMLPAALRESAFIEVTDDAGRRCRSSALPRALDGRGIYFGDIHNHTEFSDGDYPTEDAIAWARHRIGLDFTGPADHISQQGDFGGRTAVDYARYGRRHEQPGRFCRVPAFELAGAPGHQLLLARDFDTFIKVMEDYVTQVGAKADQMDSAAYSAALSGIMVDGGSLIAPAHPLGHADRWPDLADKSAFGGVEIFHGANANETHEADPDWRAPGNPREDSSARWALALGYRPAFLGNSDNHRSLPGQPMVHFHGLTAVQADQLDTASVFDAIRQRRTYATSGARIVADATLNGHPIGSALALGPREPRAFTIMVRGTAPIAETQIIHCGQVLQSFAAPADTHDITIEWTDTPEAGRERPPHEYYYVRVRQTDGHMALLSPFWVEHDR